MLQNSDAIILLGGGKGTENVARQAKILGKPVVPVGVGTSSDASVRLWTEMQKESKPHVMQEIGPHQTDLDVVAKSTLIIAEKLTDI